MMMKLPKMAKNSRKLNYTTTIHTSTNNTSTFVYKFCVIYQKCYIPENTIYQKYALNTRNHKKQLEIKCFSISTIEESFMDLVETVVIYSV